MIAEQTTLPRLADLEQAIRHRIVQRTGGRIQTLEVEVTDGQVTICGGAASFHLKQLVIQGVFDVIGTCGSPQIDIDVQIAVSSPRSDPNVDGGWR
jgi:hypothetical protein